MAALAQINNLLRNYRIQQSITCSKAVIEISENDFRHFSQTLFKTYLTLDPQ